MNLRNAVLALWALLLPAAAARGALTLNVESVQLAPGETGFIEVFFTELPPAQRERLVAYSVGLDLISQGGITFGPGPLLGEPTAHPFVFAPGTPIDDTGSGPTRIRAASAILTEPVNITDNMGLLRVPVTVARGAPQQRGAVAFVLTGGLTEFSDDVGNTIEFVPVNGAIETGGEVPEPSATLLAAACGLAALARRRRQRTRTAP